MKSTDISPNERDMIQTIRHLSADKAMTVAGIVLDLAGKESQKPAQDDNSNDIRHSPK